MIIPCYSSLGLLSITENRYKINLYSFFFFNLEIINKHGVKS
jgi:hypothetical protein